MRRSFGTCFYFLAVTVGTTLLAPCAQTQTPQSDLRPRQTAERAGQQQRTKIGVALEGGGALGLAHIGVLQWFEDHHIPVDYIAGTSMGGLVAGLYATGKTPQQRPMRRSASRRLFEMVFVRRSSQAAEEQPFFLWGRGSSSDNKSRCAGFLRVSALCLHE